MFIIIVISKCNCETNSWNQECYWRINNSSLKHFFEFHSDIFTNMASSIWAYQKKKLSCLFWKMKNNFYMAWFKMKNKIWIFFVWLSSKQNMADFFILILMNTHEKYYNLSIQFPLDYLSIYQPLYSTSYIFYHKYHFGFIYYKKTIWLQNKPT